MKLRTIAALFASSSFAIAAALAAGCVGDDATGAPGVTEDSGTGTDGSSTTDGAGGDTGTNPGNDSGGGDSGGDAGVFTPKDLQGLSLWLDNASGMTFDGMAKLTSWTDQSGNGNNALVADPCLKPSRAANALAGRDTIQLDGNDDGGTCMTVADSIPLQFGTGDFAIFVVARYKNVPGITEEKHTASFFSKRAGTIGVNFFGNTLSESKIQISQTALVNNNAVGATVGQNDHTYRRFGGTRRGLELEVWVNGASDAKTTLAAAEDVSAVGTILHIGATPTSNRFFIDGNLAELVVVKGNVTNAQITQLDAYFKSKHAL